MLLADAGFGPNKPLKVEVLTRQPRGHPRSIAAGDAHGSTAYPGRRHADTDRRSLWHLVEHVQPFLDSLAYRVETPTGSIVFTGDTQPCQSVIDLARGADALVCMCWNDQDAMDADGEAGGQCGTKGAARMAHAAGVRRLILSHIGPNLASHPVMEKGIGDVRRIYEGEIVFSTEGLALDL